MDSSDKKIHPTFLPEVIEFLGCGPLNLYFWYCSSPEYHSGQPWCGQSKRMSKYLEQGQPEGTRAAALLWFFVSCWRHYLKFKAIMKFSVFIATSADGYIATPEGSVDWLHTAGNQDADMSAHPDMGFSEFIASVDCMIMGRKCLETLSGFNLTPEQWPYGNIKIYALSHSMTAAPENVRGKVEMYAGDILTLTKQLEHDGYKHAYIDGGMTITSFLNLKLINEMIITKAPVVPGSGIALFGKLDAPVKLQQAKAIVFPNDYVQIRYSVSY